MLEKQRRRAGRSRAAAEDDLHGHEVEAPRRGANEGVYRPSGSPRPRSSSLTLRVSSSKKSSSTKRSARVSSAPHPHSKTARPSEYQSSSCPRRTSFSPHRHWSRIRSEHKTNRSGSGSGLTYYPPCTSLAATSGRRRASLVSKFAYTRTLRNVNRARPDLA